MNNYIDNLLKDKHKFYNFINKLSITYYSTYIIGFIFCTITFFRLKLLNIMPLNLSFLILESLMLFLNLCGCFMTILHIRKDLEQSNIQTNLIYKVSFVISSPIVLLSIFFVEAISILILYGTFIADYNILAIGITLYYYTLLCSSFFNFILKITISAIFKTKK